MINIESNLLQGQSGTLMRQYIASADANGDNVYVWGGGTYNNIENFMVVPVRLVVGLAETSQGRLNERDCVGYMAGTSVAKQGDRIFVKAGTFQIDVIRPIVQQNSIVGFESYLKEVTAAI